MSDEDQIKDAGAPDDADLKAGRPTRAEKKAAAEQSASAEPRFTVERLLGTDGQTITGVDHPTLVGALHDEDADAEFTRAQVERKVNAFLERPVEQQEG